MGDAPEKPAPPASERRGLLDIEVKLSDPSPIAGTQFTIYVLVTNLFDVPIWPESPQVFLPSSLQTVTASSTTDNMIRSLDALIERASRLGIAPRQNLRGPKWWQRTLPSIFGYNPEEKRVEDMLKDFAVQAYNLSLKSAELEKAKEEITKDIADRSKDVPFGQEAKTFPAEFARLAEKTKELGLLTQRLNILRDLIVTLSGSSAIIADGDLVLQNFTFDGNLYVRASGRITLDTPLKSRVVALDSSLRPGEALQPGNTAVYSVALKTHGALLFKPSQYCLQHSLNFSFDKTVGRTNTNTANQLLMIRAPIWSVMCGSIIGGVAGYTARCFQDAAKVVPGTDPRTQEATGFQQPFWYYCLIAFLTAILSAMAIVFLARKSETQSMLAVEDFWGGLVVGFLVGYTGATAFENLVNLKQAAGGGNQLQP